MMKSEHTVELSHSYIKGLYISDIERECLDSINFDARNAFFDEGVTFHNMKFGNGEKLFDRANFGDGHVSFDDAIFGDGYVSFDKAKFGVGYVSFDKVKFGDGNGFNHLF